MRATAPGRLADERPAQASPHRQRPHESVCLRVEETSKGSPCGRVPSGPRGAVEVSPLTERREHGIGDSGFSGFREHSPKF